MTWSSINNRLKLLINFLSVDWLTIGQSAVDKSRAGEMMWLNVVLSLAGVRVGADLQEQRETEAHH